MDEIIIRISTVNEPDMMEISEPTQKLIQDLVDSMIEEDVKHFLGEEHTCKQN